MQPLGRACHAPLASALKADSTLGWQKNEQGDQEN